MIAPHPLAESPPNPNRYRYQLDPGDILEPPRTKSAILCNIGSGVALQASILGQGGLIATTAVRFPVAPFRTNAVSRLRLNP